MINFAPLREIASIAAGNAATALAILLDRKVDLKVPQLKVIAVEDLASKIGAKDELKTVTLLQMTGDVKGVALFVYDPKVATDIVELLTSNDQNTKEKSISALNEMANIFSGSGASALTKFIHLDFTQTVPVTMTDMVGAIVDPVIAVVGERSEKALFVEYNFTIKPENLVFRSFFISDPNVTTIILEKLRKTFGHSNGQQS